MMRFTSNDDLRRFIYDQARNLEELGVAELAKELKGCARRCYPSFSAFLAELSLILELMMKEEVNNTARNEITEARAVVREAESRDRKSKAAPFWGLRQPKVSPDIGNSPQGEESGVIRLKSFADMERFIGILVAKMEAAGRPDLAETIRAWPNYSGYEKTYELVNVACNILAFIADDQKLDEAIRQEAENVIWAICKNCEAAGGEKSKASFWDWLWHEQ